MFKTLFYFLIVLFAGCAKVPEGDLAHIIDMPQLFVSEKDALRYAYFETGEWPSNTWWELFEDPTLSALIERALSNNFTLKRALAQVEYAYQLAKKERSKLFPELDGNYVEQWQYLSKYGFDRDFFPVPPQTTQGIPHTVNQIDLTLNFSYEFDFWGKNRALFRAALGQARAEVAEEKQAELMIAVSIAHAYFALQIKLAQKEIVQERLQERSELYALTDAQSRAGFVDAFPALSADKEVHTVQQALVFLDEGIALDKHMLAYLVGIGPETSLIDTVPVARFDRPFALPEHVAADLIARRPDLVAQLWRVEAAAQEIGAAKADFYPNINLSAFGGLESLAFGNLFRDSKMGGLVPAIHLPIFTGGRLRANLRSKVAAFNQAVYAYNDLVLKAAKEVADQIVIVQATIDTFAEQFDAYEDVLSAYGLYFSRYEAGLDNALAVLNSEEGVFEQRFLLTGLYMDHLTSVLQLIKRLGGGYHSNIAKETIGKVP